MSKEAEKNLIDTNTLDPKEVFKSDESTLAVIERVKASAKAALDKDPETDEGREQIRSVAYQVARSKTAVDDLGKDYVAELKAVTTAIDERRRTVRTALDDLKDSVRKPLTDFENREKARIAEHQNKIQEMRNSLIFEYEPTSEQVEERIGLVNKFDNWNFEEFTDQAKTVKDNAIERLSEKLASIIEREEKDKELEKLRQEKADRDEKDRLDRIANEAKEKAETDAAVKVKAAEDKAEQAKADAKKELEDQQEKDRQAEAARAANKAHCAKINKGVLDAIIKAVSAAELAPITEDQGKAIVAAIARGKVPNTTIKY